MKWTLKIKNGQEWKKFKNDYRENRRLNIQVVIEFNKVCAKMERKIFMKTNAEIWNTIEGGRADYSERDR